MTAWTTRSPMSMRGRARLRSTSLAPIQSSQRRVLERTTSGGVLVNDTILHYAQDDLPFGGIGPSGMGAYHGIEGFRTMSHAKSVFKQARVNFVDLFRPPFGKVFDVLLNVTLR